MHHPFRNVQRRCNEQNCNSCAHHFHYGEDAGRTAKVPLLDTRLPGAGEKWLIPIGTGIALGHAAFISLTVREHSTHTMIFVNPIFSHKRRRKA